MGCKLSRSFEIREQYVLDTFGGKEIPNFPGKIFRLNWGERKQTVPVSGDEFSMFIGDLSPLATEQLLFDIFKQRYPSCLNVKLVTDHGTGASAGYGFVRFLDKDEGERAIREMRGFMVLDRPLKTSQAQSKKNQSQGVSFMYNPTPNTMITFTKQPPPLDSIVAGGDDDPSNTTIFVGNLDPSVTEEIMGQSFAQFGNVLQARIPQVNKGIGFVTMADHVQAANAIAYMNGALIGTRPLRCSWGKKSNSTPTVAPPALQQQQVSEAALAAAQWQAWQTASFVAQTQQVTVQPPVVAAAATVSHKSSRVVEDDEDDECLFNLPNSTGNFDTNAANIRYLNNFFDVHVPSAFVEPITIPFLSNDNSR
eukprot:c2839_g1_i1.p1 GENE.c2839_g1_i1~~c2839_g1_i1.p1  ORF type:complete len:366 (+),score=92.50 c2839_g1_i1:138-1235(+)